VASLSAIVPATDQPASLPRCLAAIESAERPPEDVIVVDELPESTPAAARNRGAQSARGEVLVFVDADVAVHPDAFDRIRSAFAADPGLTAVFGSYDDSPEAPGAVSAFRNLLHHHVHQAAAGPAVTFWAGLGAVRRAAFAQAGGFDDGQRWLEDVELGGRLVEAGARIELDPALQGTHLKSWGLGEMIWTDFAGRGLPWISLALEGRAPHHVLNLTARHRLSAAACLAGVAALATRRPLPAAGAAVALLTLNRDFYGLLRRRGPAEAAAGVGLHVLHHLAAAAAVPAGAIAYAGRRARADANASSTASSIRSATAGYE
jgi:hypothetical protein